MVGTDTWITSRWHDLGPEMQRVRSWLDELPRDIAALGMLLGLLRCQGLAQCGLVFGG